MKNDVEGESKQLSVVEIRDELSISPADMARVIDHNKTIKEFIKTVLVEGDHFTDLDGRTKKFLTKSGAEMLCKLFGLGVRFRAGDVVFDIKNNFAMYSYFAEVYHLKTNVILAQCEGSCNSQEQKYKSKATYENGVKIGVEPVEITNIINTLKKMAQKRAFVGASIIATAASNYFTQDEEEVEAQKTKIKKTQTSDHTQFTEASGDEHGDFEITFGKYKGKRLADINKEELSGYVNFIKGENKNPMPLMQKFIDKSRAYLRAA